MLRKRHLKTNKKVSGVSKTRLPLRGVSKTRLPLRKVVHVPVPFSKTVVRNETSAEPALASHSDSTMPLVQGVAINDNLLKPMQDDLINKGLGRWLTSKAGGSKTEGELNRIVRTSAKILLQVNDTALGNGYVHARMVKAVDFFICMVSDTLLYSALQECFENYPWRPSTMIQHGYDLLEVTKWLAMFPDAVATSGFNKGVLRLQTMLTNIINGAKKSLRKEKNRRDNSIAKAVEDRKYPPGGIKQLLAVATADYEKTIGLFGQVVTITKELFTNFMQLFFVMLYLTAAQGRIGGILSLNMSHAKRLRQRGHVLTRKRIKVYKANRVGAVVLTVKTASMFDIYMQILRPAVAGAGVLMQPTDPLWINFEGRPLIEVTRLVKSYFARMNLDITTTRLRSMVETEAHRRLTDGSITADQRSSISMLSGHSASTAEEWYVRHDYDDAVQRSRALFPEDNAESDFATEEEPMLPLQWGSNHPSPPDATKAVWSPAEEECLLQYVDMVQNETNGRCPTVMATVLKRIIADYQITGAIFHQRHVFNSARLRDGYRRLRGDRTTVSK
jgi:hypothetical protein